MQFQAGFLALCFALRGVAALYSMPEPPVPRAVAADVFDGFQSDAYRRSTHDGSFSLDFDVKNKHLITTEVAGLELNATCIHCQTTGSVTTAAMLPSLGDFFSDPTDIFSDSSLGLTFNGVGATIDLDISAAKEGNITFPLFKSESPIGIDGPGFQIGVVFEVDVVLTVEGKIETEGGFKVDIPDGSTFMIPVDDSKPTVANFHGASASLLPLSVELESKVSVALRLTVQAGIMLPDLKIVDATALVGAFLSIPEVVLTEGVAFGETKCKVPASADLNINAGVFVDLGLGLDGHPIGDIHPTASTTLWGASTSTCLASATTSHKTTSTHEASKTSSAKHTVSTAKVRTSTAETTASTTKPKTSTPKSTASGAKSTASTSKHSSAKATSTAHSAPASGRPTTLATIRKSRPAGYPSQYSSSVGRNSTLGAGAPSSYPVAALLAEVVHTAYPITMTSLEKPITKFVVAPQPTAAITTSAAI
ncbi:hypothetical protein F4861DRAFT_354135 [Xylaria intraflava]|nr:hypothetical protein F4861DRAFT_354135 [Xylaria intraflava]